MSKREQYGLSFDRNELSSSPILYVATSINKNTYPYNSVLTFVNSCSIFECKSLIEDLDRCITSEGNVDEGFFSDCVENRSILYQYPNVNIDDLLIIPMQDLKELLQEWLDFTITSDN